MKIVTAARCYNNVGFIERFLRGYDFSDTIVISDGGSTDGSVELLEKSPKVKLLHFDQYKEKDGRRWNPDAPHMNFVIDAAKAENPDWLIFDDIDDVPNYALRENARSILENCESPQVNAFRLYLWNDDKFFPFMNRSFHPDYRSLWAYKPKEINIHADPNVHHGTMIGLSEAPFGIDIPMCLLHKSWDEKTIQEKIDNYTTFDIAFGHPFTFAGEPEVLPTWARE